MLKHRCLYILFIILTLCSCVKEENEYRLFNCQMDIKAGARFNLFTRFLKPLDELIFENDTTLQGLAIYYINEDKYRFEMDINRKFPNTDVIFKNLNVVFEHDSLTWIDSSSTQADISFDNIEYYTVNDSVFHFKFYGDKRSHLYGSSEHKKEIRMQADIKICLTH